MTIITIDSSKLSAKDRRYLRDLEMKQRHDTEKRINALPESYTQALNETFGETPRWQSRRGNDAAR